MQQIEQGIYLNDQYPGVTLGLIVLEKGKLLIDSPPHPDDGRTWLSMLRSLGAGGSRILFTLDAHPDRTIGTRALDTPVMAQRLAAEVVDQRPTIFKGQNPDTGAEWELSDGLSGIRSVKPSIVFTEQAFLEWGEQPVIIESHPGPASGASWVIAPEASVVFIGDAVLDSQPPFLADADIPQWIDTLDILLSKEYKNHLIVSSRGGVVGTSVIREQRRFLKDVLTRLERLADRDDEPEATEKLIPNLLTRFDFPRERESLYTQRLRYGLFEYYIRHYHPIQEEMEE